MDQHEIKIVETARRAADHEPRCEAHFHHPDDLVNGWRGVSAATVCSMAPHDHPLHVSIGAESSVPFGDDECTDPACPFNGGA